MKNLTQHIKLCIEFFTRIPVPHAPHEASSSGETNSNKSLANAAIAFPIVGFLIGALVATFWIIADYFLPALPAAGTTIVLGLILTGALHEDGLSDCADGLGGNVSKERALEIMRDSRIGSYGSAALIMTIGLRWTSLASLDMWTGFVALILSHMIGRACITVPLRYSKYARDSGLADTVSSGVKNNTFWIILGTTGLTALLLGQWQGLVAFAFALLAATLTMFWLEKRIDGYTGDGLGAIEQVAEITALLVFVSCTV